MLPRNRTHSQLRLSLYQSVQQALLSVIGISLRSSDEDDVVTLDELTLDPEDELPPPAAPNPSTRAATRKGPH